jgi:hypothetical protein
MAIAFACHQAMADEARNYDDHDEAMAIGHDEAMATGHDGTKKAIDHEEQAMATDDEEEIVDETSTKESGLVLDHDTKTTMEVVEHHGPFARLQIANHEQERVWPIRA